MIKRILITIIALPILLYGALHLTGNSFFLNALERTYLKGHSTANINDRDAFNVAEIKTSTPQPIATANRYNSRELPADFRASLEEFKTAAFVVLKDGEVISENYMSGYDDRSKTNSFSMAKTVLTMMIGIAIEEGYIESLDQAVSDFIPEFSDDEMGKTATLAHLSQMTSGYEWVEHYYSWFSPTVELYHGSDVEDFVVNGEFSAEPSTFWEYSSASTQLLGVVLKRALAKGGNDATLSEYLSEKIWQPMQMNDDALWHTDNEGMELVFCCLNTNARNFAKLGQLMLNNGNWQGQQLVSRQFIQTMITPVGKPFYGYSTWLGLDNNPAYYHFSGHLGQYIIVIPEHQMVVVRLGETRNPDKDFRKDTLPEYVREALALAGI